ncbi:MAG: single-stranded DNA-binding protein [Clostridiales bacterium]|nr:single-stranded DNA-binding protein [Clostridiales bacterium]MCF8022646.1 single-stranded DNA-binding protein [Clostridiales bacterium]
MNYSILAGRLVADPDFKNLENGSKIAKATMAVNRRFKDKDGNSVTDFINVVAWNKTAEFISNYFKKGKPIEIVGELHIRSYDDSNGIRRKAAEVQIWDARFTLNDKNGQKVEDPPLPRDEDAPPDSFGSEISFDEDDVPF